LNGPLPPTDENNTVQDTQLLHVKVENLNIAIVDSKGFTHFLACVKRQMITLSKVIKLIKNYLWHHSIKVIITSKNLNWLRQTAHDQEVVGSNPSIVYWMDVSDARYYINPVVPNFVKTAEHLRLEEDLWNTQDSQKSSSNSNNQLTEEFLCIKLGYNELYGTGQMCSL
jgi:hypothetical protein